MPDPIVSIRHMLASDAAGVAELSGELGYPASAAVIETNLAHLEESNSHAVFVACIEKDVVGWIDIGLVQHLQSGEYGEIGGLIVSSRHRGCGIGKQLVRRAEEWIVHCGVQAMLVRSRVEREGAHSFYLQNGFSRVKTSAVFRKAITASESHSEALDRTPSIDNTVSGRQ